MIFIAVVEFSILRKQLASLLLRMGETEVKMKKNELLRLLISRVFDGATDEEIDHILNLNTKQQDLRILMQ